MPAAECVCRRSPRAPRGDGVVRVRREVQGRRGKTVTSITGIPLPDSDLRELAAELKRSCGSGGSAKDGVIEIQGDQRDAVVALLEARGYRVKRAGG
jgi:translation initiation factor 1